MPSLALPVLFVTILRIAFHTPYPLLSRGKKSGLSPLHPPPLSYNIYQTDRPHSSLSLTLALLASPHTFMHFLITYKNTAYTSIR